MECLNRILDFFKYINQSFGELIVAAIIAVEGILVIWEYIQQKRDEKHDAATLMLQEIRYAEERITEFRANGQYLPAIRLLPTNSWNENIHLFVKHLDPEEIDNISSFYARAKFIDYIHEQMTGDYIKISNNLNPGTLFYNNHNLPAKDLLDRVSHNIVFVNNAIKEKLRNLA